MEPAFQRGDILFLTNHDNPIRSGEIIVFKIKDRDIPIVHRVIKVHEKADKKVILPFVFGKSVFIIIFFAVRLKY
jgi:signal peptidase